MKKLKFLALATVCGVLFAACGNNDSKSETVNEGIVEDDIIKDEGIVEDENIEDEEITGEPIVEDVSDEVTASNDWNDVLDEYEEFVDSYIKLLKKSQSGDMNALNEYASYMEKATSLSEKLEAADDDLTPAQLARYQKITMKMAQAAY